jgi:hypothetical protein
MYDILFVNIGHGFGIVLIFIGIYYYFIPRCENCSARFSWDDAEKTPIGESLGTEYLLEGNQATLCSLHYISYNYECNVCKHRNVCESSWSKMMKRIDDPFEVKICKMCKGKGKIKFKTDDDFRLVGTSFKYVEGGSGSVQCGLCDGNGWKRIKNTN